MYFQAYGDSCSRSAEESDCLDTQNVPGVSIVREMETAVDKAVCQIVNYTRYSDHDPQGDQEYDFIVVGAGSAGAVIANRLSEHSDWTVLLLEAGADPIFKEEFPFLPDSNTSTGITWPYMTEPDPNNCLGMKNGRCLLPRGKVLGGTSGIAAMFYVRGHPEDFDTWERMGNPGWGYEKMLQYFKKSEDFRPWVDSNYHGIGGYLTIEEYEDDNHVLHNLVSNGFEELGYQSFRDVNGEHHEGVFNIQVAFRDGMRCSAAKAFLHAIQSRSYLKISKNSLVKRVLIDETKTAFVVEYTKSGRNFKAIAKKELILSAGSINSPQILMLSGIGPKDHLTELGIPVVQPLNVGFNLQDHTTMRGLAVSLDLSIPSHDDVLESMFEYLVYKRGNFARVSPALNVNGFIRTTDALYPDIQIIFGSLPVNSTKNLHDYMNKTGFNENIIQSLVQKNVKNHSLFVWPSLLRPKSRGRVLLRSKSATDFPLVFPGYFSDKEDISKFIEGIRFINKLIETNPFKALKASIQQINIPECSLFDFQSDSFWECMIKFLSTTIHHPVGTCRMGPQEHNDSVVDSTLRVIGIKNLRVVDSSIMPIITSGNTNAPAIAIGEKGSDLIKEFWKT